MARPERNCIKQQTKSYRESLNENIKKDYKGGLQKCNKSLRIKNSILQILTDETKGRTEYSRKCSVAYKRSKELNRESWDNYINNIEQDVLGTQNMVFKVINILTHWKKQSIQ